jgi:4-hydroxybenzoate polyprenyltransferase
VLKPLIQALRPGQWSKNVLVFAGLIFAQRMFSRTDGSFLVHWDTVLRALAAFAAFCLASSATYLLNDVFDRAADRSHPKKRFRPIASGALHVRAAVVAAVALFTLSLVGAALLSGQLLAVLAGYVVLTFAYSVRLKHVVILDVLALAVCYVLRALAGTVVISVNLSVWLFICTILLALFLGLTKRRAELTSFESSGAQQRAVLANYSPQLLDQMISVVTASTVVSYAIYTASPAEFHSGNLVLTVPFVIYGIFRYLYLVYQKQVGTDPDKALFRDAPLLVNNLLWLVAAAVLIYLF